MPKLDTRCSRPVSTCIADLDEGLALVKQPEGGRQSILQNLSQARVRGVAAGNPKHLWRRTQALKQAEEVSILRHDDDASLARCPIDHMVFRVAQTEIADGACLDLKTLCDPRGKVR